MKNVDSSELVLFMLFCSLEVPGHIKMIHEDQILRKRSLSKAGVSLGCAKLNFSSIAFVACLVVKVGIFISS